MQVEAINVTGTNLQQTPKAAEKVDEGRRDRIREQPDSGSGETGGSQGIQPEELLNQIKALTEDGLYSVRFENSLEFEELIVKVVDSKTEEVIRQVPAEEILGMRAQLDELRGKIVNTTR